LSAIVSSLASKISSDEGNSERVNSDTTEYKSPKTPLYQERPDPESLEIVDLFESIHQ